MTVPYERLAEGQSGRWVYQVMGKRGPILNPTGIRYLAEPPPGISHAAVPGGGLPSASALMGYAQIANLGVSVVNLGVSVATLAEVRKQTRLLRQMQSQIGVIRSDIASLLERTERIDVAVAEVHLRDGLRHAVNSATAEGEVDLVVLASYAGAAISKFQKSIGGLQLGAAPGLVLASDVRELVQSCHNILWAARRTAVDAHNRAVAGDAARVAVDQGDRQELARSASIAAALFAVERRGAQGADELNGHLNATFRFFGRREHLLDVIRQHVPAWVEEDLLRLPGGAAGACLRDLVKSSPDLETIVEGDNVFEQLLAYVSAWAVDRDAGLLWRLSNEVGMQEDAAYWVGLDSWLDELDGGQLGVMAELDWSFLRAASA